MKKPAWPKLRHAEVAFVNPDQIPERKQQGFKQIFGVIYDGRYIAVGTTFNMNDRLNTYCSLIGSEAPDRDGIIKAMREQAKKLGGVYRFKAELLQIVPEQEVSGAKQAWIKKLRQEGYQLLNQR